MFGAQTIESPQRKVSVLALSKTGLGTPVLSGLCASFCQVIDNGVGDYTIVVNVQRPFAQKVHAFVQLHTSGIAVLDVVGTTKLQVQVKTFAADGTTPAEKDFDLMVVGSFATDLIGI